MIKNIKQILELNYNHPPPPTKMGLETWRLIYVKAFKKVISFSRKIMAAFVSECYYCFLTKRLDSKNT